MGLIFDIHSARLYESWYHSPKGRAMDIFVEKLLSSLLDLQPGERGLDIGCGAGNHLLLLNKLDLDINGVDASPYMISLAKERLGDRCSLKTGMAEDLPYDDNEFDLAILINTLEFLDNPSQALREAGRVAKKKVFIGAMNSLSWYSMCNRLKGPFCETLLNHVRYYSLWELKSYVQIAFGNVPISWKGTQILPSFFGRLEKLIPELYRPGHWPVGPFLGLAATITYRVKTDNLPLKIRVGKTKRSIAEEGITLGSLKQNEADRSTHQ